MKILLGKLLVFAICIGISGSVSAQSVHSYPKKTYSQKGQVKQYKKSKTTMKVPARTTSAYKMNQGNESGSDFLPPNRFKDKKAYISYLQRKGVTDKRALKAEKRRYKQMMKSRR